LLQAGLLASLAFFAAASAAPATRSKEDVPAGARTRLLKLPLVFEPNVGQADPRVQFLAPSRGVMLTSTGIVLALTEPGESGAGGLGRAGRGMRLKDQELRRTLVRMKFKGGNPGAQAVAREELPSKSHYFLGNDRQKWRPNVPHYGRVDLVDVFPGVNVALHGSGQEVEYDFLVAPGADPAAVKVEFEGVEGLRIDEAGDLVLRTKAGEIRQRKPQLYQEGEGGRREPVSGAYVLSGKHEVSFKVGARSRARRLVIDPVLKYSTLVGTSDLGYGVAVDGAGNAYITGEALTGAIAGTVLGGVFDRNNPFPRPGYVAKINPQGGLVYFAYLGGNCAEVGFGIAVDGVGNAYVAGVTCSIDFPVVRGFRTQYGDGVPSGFHSGNALETGFFAKVSPDGSSLLYSTYLGGSVSTSGYPYVDDIAFGVAVDGAGNAYVTGQTDSADFPTTPNALQRSHPGGPGGYAAFVTKVNPALSGTDSVVYSTFFGGTIFTSGHGIALDGAGNAYITGNTNSPNLPPPVVSPPTPNGAGIVSEAFLAKLNPSGSASLYSTYLGGTGGFDVGTGVTLDPGGNVHVAGITNSSDFPISTLALLPSPTRDTPALFAAKFDSGGSFLHSTVFGGFGSLVLGGAGAGVAVDAAGDSFITGSNRIQTFTENGTESLVVKLASTGTPVWSERLSGLISKAITLDASGGVYVAGWTPSTVNPSCPCGRSAFVARLQDDTTVPLAILNSTTRWKPQRATDPADPLSPIKIDFKGPSDLDPTTVRLEVTPPAGFFGTYTPTVTAAAKVAGADDQYTFAWNGPWTYTSASGAVLPMPRGNYELVVFGKRQNSDTEIKNETPFDKVSLVEVAAIQLEEARGAPLENNPGPGGGLRIFAEASQPGGNDISDKVKVIATVDPPIPDAPADKPVRVFFRSFDVDDPSASTIPVDDESQPTDNCLEARLGPPQNCPIADDGFLYDPIADPNAMNPMNGRAGIALSASGDLVAAGLRVAMLQGANYRIAASTSSQWVAGLDTVQRTGAGELRHTSGESLLDPANGQFRHPQVSDMLTVWRTLHLELDRMDPVGDGVTQERLQYNGSWTRIGRTWRSFPPFAAGRVLEDQNAIFITPAVPGQEIDHANPNDWKGATVDPFAFGGRECVDSEVPPCYRVTRNSNINLTVASGNLNDEADTNDRRYYLRDDELKSLTERQHDTSLLRDLLRDVYIEVAEDSPNPTPLIPFTQNLASKELELIRGDTISSVGYWSVPVLLAFESDLKRDYDPTDERAFPTDNTERGPVAGETSHGDQPVSAIFTESIRDFLQTGTGCKKPTISLEEYYRSNTAHEALHALTLDDEGTELGGLMCASVKNYVNQPGRNQITTNQKLQLRTVTRPFVNDENNGTCPSLRCQ